MKLMKIVLIFQAVVTLLLGIAFLSQVLVLDAAKISELNIQAGETGNPNGEVIEKIDIKQRYASAAYILLFVSLMELIIIIRILT